jgi:hypothetical protein
MNTFHMKIDKSTPQDKGKPQPGCDIKTYTLYQIPNLHVKDYVEKGTPRGDALFTPWSGGRDCKAAYR